MDTVAWITSKGKQYDIKDIEARRTKLNIDDLPENLSFFNNDCGFITNAVNDLVNYYKKSETYTKAQIDTIVTPKLAILIVDELPTQDISTTTIYFLRRSQPSGTTQYESDVYDEYIYVNGTWELIGNTYVDLTNYYTKSEVDANIDSAVTVEKNAREYADSALQSSVNTLTQNLSAEISGRNSKDVEHETAINANSNAIQAETTRATSAENMVNARCNGYDTHVANTSNPHQVTKTQVGLGNVTNVATTDTIAPNSNENITSGAVHTALDGKVDKVTGKGLSDQNYTYAEKTKLAGLSNYNDTPISNRVTATENAITTLNGNSTVSGSVDKKIADAIAGVTQIDFQIVASLPATGVKGVIYLIKDNASTLQNNIYNEYIWVGSSYELIGQTMSKIDLTNYYTKSEVDALVSVKANKSTKINNHELSGDVTITKSDVGLGNVGNFKAVSTVASQGLTTTEKSNARTNIGAGTSSFSGSYTDLSNKPTLGTASAKDVPSSGNASTTQVVMGNDTRLSNARTPTAHTHTKSQITDFPTLATVATSGSYNDLSNKPTIPAGVVVDSSLSSTSTNPVQNKVINSALASKAGTSTATSSANGLMSSSDKAKLDNFQITSIEIV